MKINILTLFPEMFESLRLSILGRAEAKGLIEFNVINIRDFSKDRHNKADDYSYGGGQGMIMMCQPIFDSIKENSLGGEMLYMSPRGKIIDMDFLETLSEEGEVTILCGHYEGVDERVIETFGMKEVSIGDYVLTGGEPAALVLVDALSRLIPGVLSGEASAYDESIYSGLLEYPQYTKPSEYEGNEVPPVLLSGDHRKIYLWRYEQSLRLTLKHRPDLFEKYVNSRPKLAKDETKVLEKILKML